MLLKFIFALYFLVLIQAFPTTENKIPIAPIHNIKNVNRDDISRIMGGKPAVAGQIPFQVAIISSGLGLNDGFCGGTLISETVVITAAHCVFEYTDFEVIMGTLRALDGNSVGRAVYNTKHVVVHEEFDFDFGLNNDIALLIFDSPVTLTETIQPLFLPKRSEENETFIGLFPTTSGWGTIGDESSSVNEDLLYVDVQVLINYICEYSFGAAYMPPTKMCLNTHEGTKGACFGDSGGPLYIINSVGEEILIGIVSFGASAGCELGYPEIYTRVTSFLDWVTANGGPAVRP